MLEGPAGKAPPFRRRRAFPRDDNVALLIKTMAGRRAGPDWQQVQYEAATDPRIVVIDEVMPRDAMFALLSACDCFVSLHRSEGFGRCIAEAMRYGSRRRQRQRTGSESPLGSRRPPECIGNRWQFSCLAAEASANNSFTTCLPLAGCTPSHS
jgi:glycosyltransferase involved in cell wall biosynthesis